MGGSGQITTIPELLAFRANTDPDRVGFRFLPGAQGAAAAEISYAALKQDAEKIAAGLHERGIQPGDRVLLLLPGGLDFIAAFFGILCAGATAVPAYPPHPARMPSMLPRLQSISVDARPAAILSNTEIESAASDADPSLAALKWIRIDGLQAGSAAWKIPAIHSNALAVIQYTSGSMASPKGVMITQRNLLRNSEIIQRAFGHSPQSRGVIWLPPYHDMGLIGGLLQPLFAGFPVTLMSPASFLMRPLRWLEVIAQERATTSGGPNFAFDLCVRKTTPEQRSQLDLRSWKVVFVGAEPVRAETLERFAEAFAVSGFRKEAFCPCYGLAESTLFVTGRCKGEGPVVSCFSQAALSENRGAPGKNGDARSLVGCGSAPPESAVAIVDPDRLIACPENHIGEIWVASDSVAEGYFNRAAETERAFKAFLADSGAGPFLRTGDLGFLHDGELFLTGRLKNLIIAGGRNHSAEDIESTVETAAGVGCCVAFSVDVNGEERLVIAAELKHGADASRPSDNSSAAVAEITQTIRQAVAERHDLRAHSILLLRPASLSRTTSGKVERHRCREEFVAGTLKVVKN